MAYQSRGSLQYAACAGQVQGLALHPVTEKSESSLWNEYVQRYHYLGYQPLPGDQLRYFIKTPDRILGLLGFGAAAWRTGPRDQWIGWTPRQRRKGLLLILNNARFLILPWVTSRHLASKVLGLAARQLPRHWQARYGFAFDSGCLTPERTSVTAWLRRHPAQGWRSLLTGWPELTARWIRAPR